jgi:hypothetical protein
MTCVNGTGNAMQITRTQGERMTGDPEAYFVKFNFGLTWGHVAKAITVLAGGVAALAAAGWLSMPASQTALDKVTIQLIETNKQVIELQTAVKTLTGAVDALNAVVNKVATTPSLTRPQRRGTAGARAG